jgi:hypothetical protein
MLAQFFSNVTPSEKLRKGWQAYYREVDAEYKQFLAGDSIMKERLKEIVRGSSNLKSSDEDLKEISDLRIRIAENERIKNAGINLPESNSLQMSGFGNSLNSAPSIPIIHIKIRKPSETEPELIESLLAESGFDVKEIEEVERGLISSRNNVIRYFLRSDFESVAEINQLLADMRIETTIQYVPRLASKNEPGTIELWLK